MAFINDVTQFWPKITHPHPLCHTKMDVLPTPSYIVSQKYLPDSPLIVWRYFLIVP